MSATLTAIALPTGARLLVPTSDVRNSGLLRKRSPWAGAVNDHLQAWFTSLTSTSSDDDHEAKPGGAKKVDTYVVPAINYREIPPDMALAEDALYHHGFGQLRNGTIRPPTLFA